MVSAGDESRAELDYVSLLYGRTLKGTTYGGVRIHSDLPKIIEKCINKVMILCFKPLFSPTFRLLVTWNVRRIRG